MTTKFHAFHWPDHVIGKRESRRIRDEHNALFNSHHELASKLREVVIFRADAFEADEEISGADLLEWFAEWRETAKALLESMEEKP